MSKNRSRNVKNKIEFPKYLNVDALEKFSSELRTFNKDHLIGVLRNFEQLADSIELLKWIEINRSEFTPYAIGALFDSIPDIELKQSEYLNNRFKLNIKEPGKASFVINKKQHVTIDYEQIKPNLTPSMKLDYEFNNKLITLSAAFLNNNIKKIDELCEYIIGNIDNILNILGESAKTSINSLAHFINMLNPQYQDKMLLQYKDYLCKTETAVSIAVDLFIKFGDFLNAKIILDNAINNYNDQADKRYLGSLYHIAQRVEMFRGDLENSVAFGKKALKCLPNNIEILKVVAINTAMIGDEREFFELVEKLPSKVTKDLLANYFYSLYKPSKYDKAFIKNLTKKQLPEEFHKLFVCLNFQLNQESKIQNVNSFTSDIKYLKNNNIPIETVVQFSIKFGYIGLARKLAKEAKTKLLEGGEYLLRIQSLLNDGNDTKLLNEITESSLDADAKAKLHHDAATYLIAENKLDKASDHLSEALKLDPENEEYLDTKKATEILSQHFIPSNVISTSPNQEEQIEHPEHADWDRYCKDLHNHYKMIKAQKLISISEFSSKLGWKISENIHISFMDTTDLGTHKGLKYRGCISGKIQDKKTESSDRLEAALDKGIIMQKFGKNGVKFLSDKVIELKINDDLRLCTNKVYVNNDKDLLIYFDDSYSHEGVENFVSISGALNYIDA